MNESDDTPLCELVGGPYDGLVTGNTSHFAWIAGLGLEDWRQPR